jgi:caa(3)-type oxidase subunit IV
MSYAAVWFALVTLTLVEVGLAWVHTAPTLMLALLLFLSFAKAALIAWYFMHLRTYRPKPLMLLIPGLFLCIGFLLALLPDGLRAWSLR